MPRLFPLPQLTFLVCAAALPVGCKTVYSDVYSPRGNHFVPPKEKKIELPVDKKANEAQPVQAIPAPAAPDPNALPGLPPAPAMDAPPALPPPVPAP